MIRLKIVPINLSVVLDTERNASQNVPLTLTNLVKVKNQMDKTYIYIYITASSLCVSDLAC